MDFINQKIPKGGKRVAKSSNISLKDNKPQSIYSSLLVSLELFHLTIL